jgi:predicted DNA-binding protein
MVRTEIYLTEEERGALNALATSTGKKQAQLIREAVDRFIELASGGNVRGLAAANC